MTTSPKFISLHEEEKLAKDPMIYAHVLKACRRLQDHYMVLEPSKRTDGPVVFLYVDWHWAHSPRVYPAASHKDSVELLVRNMPSHAIIDAKRKWRTDMRPFGLPAFIDVWLEDGHKRILLHHRKVGI